MAMLPQLFTLNGLATEMRLDRRMVGNILAHVPPDGELKGKPAWRLTTFLRAREAREACENRSREPLNDVDLIELERAAREVDALLDELRAAPDLEQRRRLLQAGRGHVVGAFVDAIERSRVGYSKSRRMVEQPFFDQTCGQAIAEVMALCGWEIQPHDHQRTPA
jgi:hypothetical protein